MNPEDVRIQVAQYVADLMERSERLAFERLLLSDCDLRAEVDELREAWDALGAIPLERPSAALRARFYRRLDEVSAQRKAARHWWMPQWSPSFAPQAVGALALFLIGFYVRGSVADSNAAEIAQLHLEVRNMREMLAVSLLDRQSASARLEGISWGKRVDHPDGQVAAALLAALNHDANVNVRLSSVDALQSLAGDASIRRALIDSIFTQQSPLVQIALIDALVQLRAKDASAVLEKMADDAQFETSVQGHARWALQQLRNP